MIKFVHSLWSKPLKDDNQSLECELYCFALSCSLLKRLGQHVVLHTDKFGRDMLAGVPYDEVRLTLDSHDCLPRFWASGKIAAQKNEDANSVHIDGDVFVFNKSGVDVLSAPTKVLVYGIDKFCHLLYPMLQSTFEFLNLLTPHEPRFLKYKQDYWDNCSVIKITDKALRDEYLDGYMRLYNACKNDKDIMEYMKNLVICPDCTLEQYWLGVLCKSRGVKINRVNEFGALPILDKHCGVVHLSGARRVELPKIKQMLKEEFPDVYAVMKLKMEVQNGKD